MPAISGCEFLDAFKKLDKSIKKLLKVYLLSSSVDYRDKERAAANKNVPGYIEKPLTEESFLSVFDK